MNTLEMFPLNEFEQTPRNDGDGTKAEAERVPNPRRTGGPDDIGEPVPTKETAPIFEATGITGEFELDPIAKVFPEFPEGLGDLAANVEVNGLVEEPTLARTRGPGSPLVVVDGKRRIRAAKMADVQITYKILRDEIDPRAYVWAKNAMRTHLEPSQRALAFAELFPKLPPGRPPLLRDNCRNSDNLPSPTQGQGAEDLGISRDLISQAYSVADPAGTVAPNVREAVRNGILTIHDVLQDNVGNASKETQQEALSLVIEGRSTTISRAVDKLAEERKQRDHVPYSELRPPTRLGRRAEFHCGFVDDLQRFVEPGRVDLVISHPPEFVSMTYYSHIAELADHALSEAGVLVVVVPAGAPLHGILNRLYHKKRGFEFIAEFSLLSPLAFTDLGDPHYTRVRRAALLVYGKRGTILPAGDDIIVVPGPTGDMAEDDFMEIGDCLPLVVHRFARTGQTVLFPTLSDSRDAVAASLELGCTVIGADQDQSVIDVIVREASEPTQSASADQESE